MAKYHRGPKMFLRWLLGDSVYWKVVSEFLFSQPKCQIKSKLWDKLPPKKSPKEHFLVPEKWIFAILLFFCLIFWPHGQQLTLSNDVWCRHWTLWERGVQAGHCHRGRYWKEKKQLMEWQKWKWKNGKSEKFGWSVGWYGMKRGRIMRAWNLKKE